VTKTTNVPSVGLNVRARGKRPKSEAVRRADTTTGWWALPGRDEAVTALATCWNVCALERSSRADAAREESERDEVEDNREEANASRGMWGGVRTETPRAEDEPVISTSQDDGSGVDM
jgi:hypothetical protein